MRQYLALLLALCWSVPALSADLGNARALVEQKRYNDAITEFNVLIEASPANTDLLIEAARVNAWADRHPQSAALYRKVVERAPLRRGDVILPLAWQLAWDNRHEEAIPLFRETATLAGAQQTEALHGLAESLAATNQLPEALGVYRQLSTNTADLKASQGEARVLLWLDRHDEAAARYRDVLNTQPNDKEAQIGLARALNHSGRHLAAVSVYQTATRREPALALNTRVERSLALRWAGLEDQALQTLGDAAGKDADTLRGKLKQETASHLRAEFESARDSDELDINALTLGWQQRFSEVNTLDVSARGAHIEQNNTLIQGRQLLARMGTRLGNTGQGLLWPALTLGIRDYDGWQTAAWKLQGKWIPADFWRVDVEAGNDVVETITALNNRATLNFVAASTDWRFAPRWSATLGGAVLRFDDDNQRTRLVGRIEHVLLRDQPKLILGIEGMGFNDSDPTIARGYYNPERYRELKLFAQAEHETAGWILGGRLALGRLWETPGSSSGLYAWELSAARNLDPMLRLRLYAGGSDSSAFLRTGGGYTRNYLGASLIWFF